MNKIVENSKCKKNFFFFLGQHAVMKKVIFPPPSKLIDHKEKDFQSKIHMNHLESIKKSHSSINRFNTDSKVQVVRYKRHFISDLEQYERNMQNKALKNNIRSILSKNVAI